MVDWAVARLLWQGFDTITGYVHRLGKGGRGPERAGDTVNSERVFGWKSRYEYEYEYEYEYSYARIEDAAMSTCMKTPRFSYRFAGTETSSR